MKNLLELVRIKSNQDEKEMIEFLKLKLKDKVEEIKILENKQDKKKSILVGVNTTLKDVCPHCAIWTHRYG